MTLAAEHDPANAFLSPEAVLFAPSSRFHRGTSLIRMHPPPGSPQDPAAPHHLGTSMMLAAEHDPANAFLSPESVLFGPILQLSQGNLAHTNALSPGEPLGPYSVACWDPP